MIFKKSNSIKMSEEVVSELRELEKQLKKAEKDGKMHLTDSLCGRIADFKLEKGLLD
jgi:hypothetical protein